PEADLQTHLPVLDLPLLDLPAHLGHLEPVQVAQGFRGPADAVADGLIDAVVRGADDLGDAVGVVRHAGGSSPWRLRVPARTPPATQVTPPCPTARRSARQRPGTHRP